MKYLAKIAAFILVLICQFVDASEQLIPLKDLISDNTLSVAKINQQGNLLVTAGYTDGRLSISAYNLENEHLADVFFAKEDDWYRLSNIQWIDEDSFVYRTFRQSQKNTSASWIVNLTVTKQSLSVKTSRINARGYIIDPLEEENDYVWFAHYPNRNKPKKMDIYKTHTSALIRDNFREQQEFTNRISEADHYTTDTSGSIKFARAFDKDEITSTYWYLDENQDWQELYQFDPYDYEFEPVGFLPNGKLAVISNLETDVKSLVEFDVKTKTFANILYQHARYDLESAKLNKTNQRLEAIAYFDQGEWRIEYFDSEMQKLEKRLSNTFSGKQYSFLSASEDESIVVLKVFSSTEKGQYYLWHKHKNLMRFLGEQNSNLTKYTFQPTATLDITSESGHKIEAYFTQPPNHSANNVLLVMPHGGPIGPRDINSFNSQVQFLTNRGYSVLQVNYRGSQGFGRAFKNSGRGQWGRKIEQDISTAVDQLIKQTPFKHVCAIGASYGGYSSVMLAILHPERYDCVIARFGVFDLPLIFNDRNTKKSDYLQQIWSKVVGENTPKLKDYSPVYFADQLKAPILITAGRLDTRASFEHSNRLKYVLEKNKHDVEHVYYRYSAHGHANAYNTKHELAYIDQFIRRKLSIGQPKSKNAKQILAREKRLIRNGLLDPEVAGVRPDLLAE